MRVFAAAVVLLFLAAQSVCAEYFSDDLGLDRQAVLQDVDGVALLMRFAKPLGDYESSLARSAWLGLKRHRVGILGGGSYPQLHILVGLWMITQPAPADVLVADARLVRMAGSIPVIAWQSRRLHVGDPDERRETTKRMIGELVDEFAADWYGAQP